MKHTLLLLFAIAPLGCEEDAAPAPRPEPKYEEVSKAIKSEDAFNTIRDAEKVTLYRLEDSYHEDTVDKYEAVGDPVDLKPAKADELRQLLLSPSGYLFDRAKGCEPIYGVRVAFRKGENQTDVLFCFGCDILAFYFNGKPSGGEDFDPIRMKLLGVIKPAFPDDEAIQSLKKR